MSDLYKKSGVDIDAGAKAVSLMKDAVRATYTDAVLSGIGNFGGLFSLASVAQMQNPVLVASTDGVGTKTKVASAMNKWDTIGMDLVFHCINDILVQGATPLFFMDYVASDKLDPQQIADIVRGMASACKATNTVLLGGETAEMAGVYVSGEVDVVGTIVGMVEEDSIIDGSAISTGDKIIALPSSGLHTNGYTLARSILADDNWHEPNAELGMSVGEALLEPHRCYLSRFLAIRDKVDVLGMAHITGGGVIDNLPRILPDGLGAHIDITKWTVPPLFQMIQARGNVSRDEMFRVFNMGLGLLIVVRSDSVQTVLNRIDDAFVVGDIVARSGVILD